MTAQAQERGGIAHGLAKKFRKALLNGTGAHFTSAEIAFMFESGVLEAIGLWSPKRGMSSLVGDWPLYEVVYFIGPADGPVKIGYASELRARWRHLKYMSPAPLHIWGYVPGDMRLEKRYHEQFGHLRMHGEWFERSEDLMAEIVRLRELVGAQ